MAVLTFIEVVDETLCLATSGVVSENFTHSCCRKFVLIHWNSEHSAQEGRELSKNFTLVLFALRLCFLLVSSSFPVRGVRMQGMSVRNVYSSYREWSDYSIHLLLKKRKTSSPPLRK